MSFYLICIGFIFLLNPCVNAVDVLPDFVGALLIFCGSVKLSNISESVENTIGKLWGLFAVGLLRVIGAVLYANLDGSFKALVTFSLSIGEAMLIPVIFSGILGGLENLKIRYGTVFSTADGKKDAYRKYDISKLKTPLTVYTIVRLILSFLPEMTELRLTGGANGSILDPNARELYTFKPMLYGVITVPLCIAMLFIAVKCIKAFHLYVSDRGLVDSVRAKLESDRVEFPTKYARNRLKVIYVFMLVGMLLSMFVYTDGINRIPKIAAALVFALFFAIYASGKKEKLLGFISCGATAVLSVAYYLVSASYFAEFTEENPLLVEEAGKMYVYLSLSEFFEAAAVFVMLLAASMVVLRNAKAAFSIYSDKNKVEERTHKVKKQIILFRILSFVFCAAAALYLPLRTVIAPMNFILIFFDICLLLLTYFLDLRM